jgi:hypothetical protein
MPQSGRKGRAWAYGVRWVASVLLPANLVVPVVLGVCGCLVPAAAGAALPIVTTLAGWEQLRSWPLSHKIELAPERE